MKPVEFRKLTFHIYRPGHSQEGKGVMLWTGSFQDIRGKINELVDGQYEHVAVLFNGRRADMFVEEHSAGSMPVNELATKIYHASSLSRDPKADTSTWPKVYGPAIVFDEIVWS